MRLTYKYRIYPTPRQAAFLEGQLHEAAILYNAALQERRDAWVMCGKTVGFFSQSAQLKDIRREGLTGIVAFDVARNVLRRVDRAFQGFFRRCKKGGSPGYPRFRSAQRYDSIGYDECAGIKLLASGRLRVFGTTPIRLRLHRPLVGEAKTATIRRHGGRWFVAFSTICVPRPLAPLMSETGLDVGLSSFATLSDGSSVANPRLFAATQRQVRRARRRITRKPRGSAGRRRAIQSLQRQEAHLTNQRADFHHKLSRRLVNEYGLIAVEDLNVKGLAGGMLAKQVHDAGWSSFIEKLAYKAESAGRDLVRVDPKGTSQTCVCGAAVPKRLSDRWHECPSCGLSAPRDVVSARVILQRAGKRPSGANVAAVGASVGLSTSEDRRFTDPEDAAETPSQEGAK